MHYLLPEVIKVYRLQVLFKGRWKWGIVEYDTFEDANTRVEELAKVKIKARVRKNFELFN